MMGLEDVKAVSPPGGGIPRSLRFIMPRDKPGDVAYRGTMHRSLQTSKHSNASPRMGEVMSSDRTTHHGCDYPTICGDFLEVCVDFG